MAAKAPPSSPPGSLLRKVRKPLAPPMRVAEDERKYKRARERDRLRKIEKEPRKPSS